MTRPYDQYIDITYFAWILRIDMLLGVMIYIEI